jgi:hypothetical protein
MSKHTPGPWEVKQRFDIYANGYYVGTTRGNFEHDDSWPHVFIDEANAERIVRIWNCHDELLAALKECVEDSQSEVDRYILDYGERYRPATLAALRETVRCAREAIAKAEEE